MAIEIKTDASISQFLGEQTIYEQGTYKRMRRYYSGWFPNLRSPLDTLHHGWSGRETVVECDAVRPIGVFRVEKNRRI